MSETLAVAANVVGVLVPTLTGMRLLLHDLQTLKEAPQTIRRLEEDIRSVCAALDTLRAVENSEWESLGVRVATELKTTISSCAKACDQFKADLKHWTRHSQGRKLVMQDRASVGFLKQGQVKAMSEQIINCRLSVNSVVSIATLYERQLSRLGARTDRSL